MWNPFSKKNNEFKLDDEKLPSLAGSEQEKKNQFLQTPRDTSLESHSSPINPTDNTPVQALDIGMSSSNTLGGVTSSYKEQMANSPNNSINNSLSHHEELSKAKMETMEAKIQLMEAKLSSIDQKLEVLNQMIYAEISDETKKKFKIDSMMKRIK